MDTLYTLLVYKNKDHKKSTLGTYFIISYQSMLRIYFSNNLQILLID